MSAEQAPKFVRYFGFAALVGFGGDLVGTAAGIYIGCHSPGAGNLCGMYGALGVGPLLSGIALIAPQPRQRDSWPTIPAAPLPPRP